MKVALVCSETIKPILAELFSLRNIELIDDADLYIVESGFVLPSQKLCIVFTSDRLQQLLSIIDQLNKPAAEAPTNMIGKQVEGSYSVIPIEKICYFEARGNATFCITDADEYKIKEKLYQLEDTLPKRQFIRISKSFIVNISNVTKIIPWFERRLVLRFNKAREVEVSKNFVKSFKQFLGM